MANLIKEIQLADGEDSTMDFYTDGTLEVCIAGTDGIVDRACIATEQESRQLYEAMKQHFEPSPWVSVEDGMPKVGQTVLVKFDGVDDVETDYVEHCADTGVEYFANFYDDGVTHWMPIPEVKE